MVDSEAAQPSRDTGNPRTMGIVALLIHLVSWISPVHTSSISGYTAFIACWPLIGRIISGQDAPTVAGTLSALSPHTNYVFVIGCVLVLGECRRLDWFRPIGWLLRISIVCDAVWLMEGERLRFGYFLWLVSFVILILALGDRRKATARNEILQGDIATNEKGASDPLACPKF